MADIIHVDMDCFFAAVEVKDNPDLRGKPVIVGALPGTRGVVCACSYEARKYGVRSAMPVSRAYKVCPEGVFLPPRGSRYVEESEKIQAIFRSYTPLVEPLSLDEAFLDVSGSHALYGTSREIGMQIKKRILDETGLVASVGVAPSKFVAKIASDLRKPNGFVVVGDDEVLDFLAPLDVGKIWGVGKATLKKLHSMDIRQIIDLRQHAPGEMVSIFGKTGLHLHNLAWGIDHREVHPETERKQVSNEHTFNEDVSDNSEVERTLLALSDKVASRLTAKNLKGKTITLKLRFDTFETVTRSHTFESPVSSTETIYGEIRRLFRKEPKKGRKTRLVGVGVSGFETDSQISMFKTGERDEKMEKVIAGIRQKFGKTAITRASLIQPKKDNPKK